MKAKQTPTRGLREEHQWILKVAGVLRFEGHSKEELETLASGLLSRYGDD